MSFFSGFFCGSTENTLFFALSMQVYTGSCHNSPIILARFSHEKINGLRYNLIMDLNMKKSGKLCMKAVYRYLLSADGLDRADRGVLNYRL